MKYVLDSSVVAKLFRQEADTVKVERLIERAARGGAELLVPELVLYEVNNVLVKNRVPKAEHEQHICVLMDLVDAGILDMVAADRQLLAMAYEIANQAPAGQDGHISSFDALFHALALREKAVLVTADSRHARKTRDLIGSIETLTEIDV